MTTGSLSQAQYADRQVHSLRAIAASPFDVMLEVEVEDRDGRSQKWLWYGGEGVEVNMPLRPSAMPVADRVAILAWTHPGLQAGLAESLGEPGDLWNSGLKIVAVTPDARARFQAVLPQLIGIYEPGGSVGHRVEVRKEERAAGLKSVKLGMTTEQVRAFVGPMSGIMLVTGAPGSGKTTVALQRIRYLLDQQDQRTEQTTEAIQYSIDDVHIFLANRNLIQHTRNLLRQELQIPDKVVHMVSDFVEAYVDDVWAFPLSARRSVERHRPIDTRAREALFSRCDGSDLKKAWRIYERQIAKRLGEKKSMTWAIHLGSGGNVDPLANELKAAANANTSSDSKLSMTPLSMGRVYSQVGRAYEKLRASVPGGRKRDDFDEHFAKWLYHVYDPVDALRSILQESQSRSRNRVERATAGRVDGTAVLNAVVADLGKRVYPAEALGWIALLFRFVLPTDSSATSRFRRVPHAFESLGSVPTHVVIDEAQDLSAPEAAFFSSLADERGALTISADFRQRVSPSKGIGDVEAIQLGAVVPSEQINKAFRFTQNMRQSLELTQFLRAFYEVAFGEVPHFEASPAAERIAKPQLVVGDDITLGQRIKTLRNVLKRAGAVGAVAVLQVNADPAQRKWAQNELEQLGVRIIDGAGLRQDGAWTLANVEEIKGLEYDTCVVLGLDDIDAAELDNFKNRAYVAISRPTRRLVMLCNHFPSVLKGIPEHLYERAGA